MMLMDIRLGKARLLLEVIGWQNALIVIGTGSKSLNFSLNV